MLNTYKLPELGYAYDALEPFIDARTMEVHHSLLHANYVNKSNLIFESHPEAFEDCPRCLLRKLASKPAEVRTGLRNMVGGHVNHSLFWQLLKKDVTCPQEFKEILEKQFGSLDKFKEEFTNKAVNHFSAGWAWLVLQKDGSLEICSTANQDNPLMGKEICGCEGFPIIGLDVWEHAYFLGYENRRAEYVNNFWNVLNWEQAYKNYKVAQSKYSDKQD